ncbi:MAG: N-acetylglucosaminyldiphosphoundecaprenol [Bacillota bacterium]|nr:MAG: N-acetylglucosaminyldiphosphoundecaprenol [Bacillota bacterium]
MKIVRVSILSYPVAKLTLPQTVAAVLELISARRGHIITANAEILYAAKSDAALDSVIRAADLVTADGMGVVWASRILGDPLPERVSGYDLLHAIAQQASQTDLGLFLLGAAPGVAEAAAAKLQRLYSDLIIAGTYHGFFKEEESVEVMERVKSSNADFLFVAMGLGGEAWIYRHKQELNCPAMQVGGSFDILAGIATRAPRWMQKSGLEWAHRLYREPKRYRRMLSLPKFVIAVIAERFREKGVKK